MICRHRDRRDGSITTRSSTHAFATVELALQRPHFRFVTLCFALPLLLLTPAEGRAWGPEAHMIIALVAEQLIQAQGSPAQQKLTDLLASDKSNNWTKTDIAGEATWADALREKSPEGRAATTKWHYVKLNPGSPDLNKACFGKPALPAMAPASHGHQDDCIVDKIEQFARELRDPDTSPGERLMALQFLLNFVGDIHDPLHAIEHHDQEGHCVALLPPGAKAPVRLSDYWDDILVVDALDKDPARAAMQIVASLSPADARKWSGGTPADWAQESHNVARQIAYSFAKDPAKDAAGRKYSFPARKGEHDPCGPVPLYNVDSGYRDRAAAAVKEQLAKAGVRLAFLLRENLQ